MKCESMKGSVWKFSAKDLLSLKDNLSQETIIEILVREADLFQISWKQKYLHQAQRLQRINS